MLRAVSFAAMRSWRCPWVTPRISRGAVLAVTAFSFARWRGKSAPRRGRCAASGSVPHLTCFGLTPRSPAAWARAAASFWRRCRAWVSANFRPCRHTKDADCSAAKPARSVGSCCRGSVSFSRAVVRACSFVFIHAAFRAAFGIVPALLWGGAVAGRLFILFWRSHTLTSVRLYALPQRPSCCFCRNRRRWTA